VKLMAATARTELFELQPTGIVSAILLGRVVPLAAHSALEGHDRTVNLRLLGHCTTSFPALHSAARCLNPGSPGGAL